jgi:hypothetical protein
VHSLPDATPGSTHPPAAQVHEQQQQQQQQLSSTSWQRKG